MSLFNSFSNFLESKLDEFLLRNPNLKLEMLLDELNEEKQNTIKSITRLTLEQPKLEQEIFSVAQDIQKWHIRIDKAEAAKRFDLAQAAREKEALLLRLGNLLWKKRANVEKNLSENKELLLKIEKREKEVKLKLTELKTQKQYSSNNSWDNINWDNISQNQSENNNQYNSNFNNVDNSNDDFLEKEFEHLETEEELTKMKRDLNL